MQEEAGWRGMAVRAGLVHPASPRMALIPTAHSASFSPPRLAAFGLPPQQQQQQQVLSKWRRPLALFSSVSHLDAGVQLSGTHSMGVGTVLEALVQGSKVHLDELRLTMSKTLLSPSLSVKSKLCDSAKLALCLASDLQQRSRATLESMIWTKEDGHTVSCVLSSDFQSQLAWGVASSHRLAFQRNSFTAMSSWLGKTWTFFTRFSKDDYAGERFILQAVLELSAMNKLSAIYSANVRHHPQAGFSWTQEACKEGEIQKSLSFKGLCSGDGNFSLSIKAEFGSVE